MDFHRRVRAGFLALASQRRGRYLVLDAMWDADRLHEVVTARVLQLLLSAQGTDEPATRPLAEARP
jgi:dTMP kinase